MAFDIRPSCKLQEILDMTDDKKQGKALVEYVTGLETEIRDLKRDIETIKERTKKETINKIMGKKPFKTWLDEHDKALIRREHQDWSGLQGGA